LCKSLLLPRHGAQTVAIPDQHSIRACHSPMTTCGDDWRGRRVVYALHAQLALVTKSCRGVLTEDHIRYLAEVFGRVRYRVRTPHKHLFPPPTSPHPVVRHCRSSSSTQSSALRVTNLGLNARACVARSPVTGASVRKPPGGRSSTRYSIRLTGGRPMTSSHPSPLRRKSSASPGTSRRRRKPASWCAGSGTRKVAVPSPARAPAPAAASTLGPGSIT
jgi:hypothetical protein